MKNKSLNLLVMMVLGAMLLTACSKAPEEVDPNQNNNTDVVDETTEGEENNSSEEEATEWSEKPEVAFSTLESSIMDTKYYLNDNPNGYKEYWFKGGTGTCFEQGLAAEIGYVQDEVLGYSIVKSSDDSYREEWAGLDFTGRISFGKVALTDGEARCKINSPSGSVTAPVSCEIQQADESYLEVCTGEFASITASK